MASKKHESNAGASGSAARGAAVADIAPEDLLAAEIVDDEDDSEKEALDDPESADGGDGTDPGDDATGEAMAEASGDDDGQEEAMMDGLDDDEELAQVMDAIDVDDDGEFEPDDAEQDGEGDEDDITDEDDDELDDDEDDDDDDTLPPVKEGRENMSSAAAAARQYVSLRSNDIGRGLKPTVDRAGNAIRNVSVMQKGPAMGHGFMIDDTMLDQVAGQMKGGVPMRFTHPQKMGPDGEMQHTDSLGTHVGRVTNIKKTPMGDEVRGDIEFGPHAKHVPMMGDVASYLMDLAEHDPSAFGLSTVFDPDEYGRDRQGNPVGRSKGVAACDLTGEPASNRRGLI